MRFHGKTPMVLVAWALALVSAAASDKPVRLISEAEDFAVHRGWSVVPYGENYFASTFAITFLSRQACLGAPEQPQNADGALASQEIDIPADDSYRVLARYEQPYGFSAEFTVEVLQGKRAVFRRVFGRAESPKYWAFQKGQVAAMRRWAWGGGDNIVWEVSGPYPRSRQSDGPTHRRPATRPGKAPDVGGPPPC
jgi:hypothetical protein